MATIDGGVTDDTLYGTTDADLIHGGLGHDTVYGDVGDDVIFGDDGDDVLNGQQGSNTLNGGVGHDTLSENDAFSSALFGGAGDDLIDVRRQLSSPTGAAPVTADGGDGNDTIFVLSSYLEKQINASISGGDGADTITAWAYVTGAIDSGAGDDLVTLFDWRLPLALTLGSGIDTVSLYATSATQGLITIQDFQAGNSGDRLTAQESDLSGWFTNWDFSNPFGSGHLRLVQQGGATVLQLDADGAGAGQWVDFVRFAGTTAGSFTAANLFGYDPSGAVPPGLLITGGDADDLLTGSIGPDTIQGLGGSDTIGGHNEDDLLDGGDGNDVIWVQSDGVDTAHGGAGDDSLHGDAGDRLYGDAGADQLRGYLQASGENVQLFGGAGDDSLSGSAPAGASLVADGGDDNDTFDIDGAGTFTLNGGAGADRFTLRNVGANITLTLGAGLDMIVLQSGLPAPPPVVRFTQAFSAGLDLTPGVAQAPRDPLALPQATGTITITDFQAGAGGDRLDLAAFLKDANPSWNPATNPIAQGLVRLSTVGDATVVEFKDSAVWRPFVTLQHVSPGALAAENLGGYAPDGSPPTGVHLVGGTDNEVGWGSAGADTIEGAGGNDSIDGAPGGDLLDGGAGDDLLLGESGDDLLLGGAGVDSIAGEAGSDLMQGGAGDDLLDDRVGRFDQFYGGDGNDTLIAVRTDNGDMGADLTLDGGAGNDHLYFGASVAATARLNGGEGQDVAHFLRVRSEFTVWSTAGSGGIETHVVSRFANTDASVATSFETVAFTDRAFGLYGIQQNHLAGLDGQRFDDVLVRASNGLVAYVDMNGTAGTGGLKTVIGPLPAGWIAVGSADFTGDGRAETIIQNTNTGAVYHYGTGGWGTVSASLTSDWQVKGVGDFTLDGTIDVLIRNQLTGYTMIAEMNGGTFSGWMNGPNLGTGWATIGVGDFDRDGYSDLLVQNLSNGITYYANLDNGVLTGWGFVAGGLGTSWAAREAVDLNADGYFDVVFQNTTTGDVWYVDMQGGGQHHWGVVATLPGWQVAGSGDYDNDGFGDVLVRNPADGILYYANMDNGAFTGWGVVASNLGTGWAAV